MIKKNNKLLRQIADLKLKPDPNEDQQSKIAREGELLKDIDDVNAKLAAILNPPKAVVGELGWACTLPWFLLPGAGMG